MPQITRRQALGGALALSVVGPAFAAPATNLHLGPAAPFDFDRALAIAQDLAKRAYQPPVIRDAEILDKIDYDAFQEIRFRADHSLWPSGQGVFPVELFHLGKFFKAPVRIYQVTDGSAREVQYSASLFDFGKADFVRSLPPDIGFSGFRVMHPSGKTDWLAFLGASYFRSSGQLDQYGLSARGIAIDVAMPTPEEFPRFTTFWLEEQANKLTIYGLLDGPSITGVLKIEATDDVKPVLTIDARLFARKDINRLGVAPMSSMFWFGKNNRERAIDWRPELHDSDGLALWTGANERLWRPLNDPTHVQTSTFTDKDPHGFGLLQRDRNFADYQDDGVFYDKRPSVWIEPVGSWGAGAVQLVEIPTDDETNDNVVAYWVPAAPVKQGDALRFAYRQYWLADEPFPPAIGQVIATRTGVGGIPGQPRPPGERKFAIDFRGGDLAKFQRDQGVEPVVTTSRGEILRPYALPIVGTKDWRAVFDLKVTGKEPVDLRMFLRHAGSALTETWLYQYLP